MWDKKGENLTYKFLRLLREQNEKKLALIVGDSQTGYSGRELEKLLKSKNYNVIRSFKAGETTAATVQRLRQIPADGPVSLVVVFTGGNNPSETFSSGRTEQLINTIKRRFGTPQVIIGVAPPAMKGDPATVKKVFNRESHSPEFIAKRDRMAAAIAKKAQSMGAQVVDPRSFISNPQSIETGDGIHLTGVYAKQFASQIAGKVDASLTNTTAPSKAAAKTFSGQRLGSSELAGMTAEQVVEYAKSRSGACRGLGYFTIESKGPKVSEIQKILKDKGQEIKDPEGEFGLNTLINVIKFQIQSKIRVDGCVGPETMGALGMKTDMTIPTGGPITNITLDSGFTIKGLRANQKEVADMIFRLYAQAGLSANIAAAAVVNGIKESGLKYYLVGDGGNSVGLFQIHRGTDKKPFWLKAGLDPVATKETKRQFRQRCVDQGLPPGGYKCSVRASGMGQFAQERLSAGDWRFDPERNTQTIIDYEVKAGFGRALRNADAAGASIPELAAIFSRDIERPRDKAENMKKRYDKAVAMFGNSRIGNEQKAVAQKAVAE